jgi:NADH dehydrogenase
MTGATATQTLAPTAAIHTPHRIVVVGGGPGGLELVTRLGDTFGRRGKADVALIQKARTHLLKVGLDTIARFMTRRTEPHVKLH